MRRPPPLWPRPRTLAAAAMAGALVMGLVWAYRASGLAGPTRLTILAADDLRDTTGLLRRFARDSGIGVDVRYKPIGEVAAQGRARGFEDTYDAVFAPQGDTERLPDTLERRLSPGKTIMYSPVVLGLRPGARPRIGDPGAELTWSAVAKAAAREDMSFGMVEPSPSGGSGALPALLTVATGLAGAPGALISQELYQVTPDLRSLRTRHTLKAADARQLTDRFQRSSGAGVDGLITLESEILKINKAAPGALDIHVPDGQAVMTRYTLRPLLDPAHPAAHDGVDQLTRYLMAPAAREWIAQRTHRRPAGDARGLPGAAFAQVREVEVPRSSNLLDQLTGVYLGLRHYPTQVVFVLDLSGSMEGEGIANLRRAMGSLTGTEATDHGVDTQVVVLPFATGPGQPQRLTVSAADPAAGLAQLRDVVAGLTPGGGTALYSALIRADREIVPQSDGTDESVTSIVLITDGENTEPTSLRDFRDNRAKLAHDHCTGRSARRCDPPVFPVLTGAAAEPEMRQLAEATGGRVYDARTADLAQVLRDLAEGR